MMYVDKLSKLFDKSIECGEFFDVFENHIDVKNFLTSIKYFKDIVICGTDLNGHALLRFLSYRLKESNLYFTETTPCDWSHGCEGYDLIPPKKLVERFGKDVLIIIAKEYSHFLTESISYDFGITNIIDARGLISANFLFIGQVGHYTRVAESMFAQFMSNSMLRENALKTLGWLEDELSRLMYFEFFKNILNQFSYTAPQIHGDCAYFASDLFDLDSAERIIDCGACDGDTLHNFLQLYGKNFESYDAFELLPDNFYRLNAVVESLPENIGSKIKTHQSGVSNTTRDTLVWGENKGARISWDNTGTPSKLSALDEVVYERRPSLLKMDIEGEEFPALLGAKQIINDFRPILAIAIYHSSEDLVNIPLWIKTVYPDYKLFVRKYYSYVCSLYELVLYAVPPNRFQRGLFKNGMD